jgi:hypothetical protein
MVRTTEQYPDHHLRNCAKELGDMTNCPIEGRPRLGAAAGAAAVSLSKTKQELQAP